MYLKIYKYKFLHIIVYQKDKSVLNIFVKV